MNDLPPEDLGANPLVNGDPELPVTDSGPEAVILAEEDAAGKPDTVLATAAPSVRSEIRPEGSDSLPEFADLLKARAGVQPHAAGTPVRQAFRDLTLWDVLAQGIRAPRATWRAFWQAIEAPPAPRPPHLGTVPPATSQAVEMETAAEGVEVGTDEAALAAPIGVKLAGRPDAEPDLPPVGQVVSEKPPIILPYRRAVLVLVLMALGLFRILIGSGILTAGERRSEEQIHEAIPMLLQGGLLWLAAGAGVYGLGRQQKRAMAEQPAVPGEAAGMEGAVLPVVTEAAPPVETISISEWLGLHSARIALLGLGILLFLGAYIFNGKVHVAIFDIVILDNPDYQDYQFSMTGVVLWIASIVTWLAVLAPAGFDLGHWLLQRRQYWQRIFERGFYFRPSGTFVALALIMLVAALFRFYHLDAVPPNMTSDHVEKLLDAQRVLDGTTQVFFPNNGGREAIQMYLVAVFSQLSGLGMQFLTLKWVSVLEGLLSIPVLWWMGRELFGPERSLGNRVGLLLAALVAVSYWHVALSRLALRIILTPLIMALVMVYLSRGLRDNRRADFLKAGLALGIGLYAYQAVRMIPVIVVLAAVMALFFRAHTWAERRRYIVNFAALVLIALVIFVPLGRFMLEFPSLFWMRTAGRLLGDDVITEVDPVTGAVVERNATLEDRMNAFVDNLPVLGNNIRNALLMYNYKGDVAWINGAPNAPAMDPLTGALLIAGLGLWLARLFWQPDVADWLVLPAIFIMLLPSALSIAYPVENPSATRISGTLPLVYLLAAYALAFLLQRLELTFEGTSRQGARLLGLGIVLILLGGALNHNSRLYFEDYVQSYTKTSLPSPVAGDVLRDFVNTGGAYGNAFMVGYLHWLDHRAIGIEGGRIDWPGGLVELDDLRETIINNGVQGKYVFDPQRPVMFFYNQYDEATPVTLARWFPGGTSVLRATGDPTEDFYTYTAPAPGQAWLEAFLADD